MQEKSKRLLGVAAVLIVVLALYLVVTTPQPPDKDQITDQLNTARAAIASRSANRLMAVVSATYQSPSFLNVDQLHVDLIQAFRSSGPISVETTPATITVNGNTAQS